MPIAVFGNHVYGSAGRHTCQNRIGGRLSARVMRNDPKKQERLDAGYLAKQLRIEPTMIDDESERPDIVWELDGKTVGLEITSGASSEHHRVENLGAKGKLPYLRNVSDLYDRDRRRTNEDLVEAVSSRQYAEIKTYENEWLKRTVARLKTKQNKKSSTSLPLVDSTKCGC